MSKSVPTVKLVSSVSLNCTKDKEIRGFLDAMAVKNADIDSKNRNLAFRLWDSQSHF